MVMSARAFEWAHSQSWVQDHCPALLETLTIPYGVFIRLRSQLYEQGWLTQRQLPCVVISVGNLTVGGTGKTPIVIWLANLLRTRGNRVGILSRGYRRQNAAACLLASDGEEILANPCEVGDEPFLMAQHCPGVPVAVGKDRYQLGLWVLDRLKIDCFILDDGYQHLGLYRDCDLLLLDALDHQGLKHLLPAGRLREPLSAARRASGILVTRIDQATHHSEIIQNVETAIEKRVTPVYVQFRASKVKNIKTGQIQSREWIDKKRALIFSGIGNTRSFHNTVEQMGVTIVEELTFPDHFTYTTPILRQILNQANRKGADMILTTEKDEVKIVPLIHECHEIWAVCLETNIQDGEAHLLDLMDRLSL